MISRNTIQKNIVYTALCHLNNHPTADEVYDTIHAKYPTVSRTTVYRVLNQMAENGKIYRVKVSEGADHFDHTAYRHDHIRCEKCGKVCDIKTNGLGDMTDRIENAAGFTVTGFSVEFNGICSDCAGKNY